MNWPAFGIALLFSYLAGSVPAGLLLGRLKGVDIRTVGSGNIGATNVFRSVSKSLGLLTLAVDVLKGFLPAFFFPRWLDPAAFAPAMIGLLCGCAAIAGHNWPLFLRFKGGKGVATSAGVLLAIVPSAVGIGLLAWLLLLAITGYVAVASMGAALSIAAASWLLYRGQGLFLPVMLTLLGLLVIYTHRGNIRRLRDGTEHRFRSGKKLEPQRTQRDAEADKHR